jgi:hypothetical protein
MPPYESTDIHVGKLWIVAALLGASLLILAGATYALLAIYDAPHYPSTRLAAPAITLDPELAARLHAYREAQRARLDSYGWIDREAGIAHIPIERALDLAAGLAEARAAEAANADDAAGAEPTP